MTDIEMYQLIREKILRLLEIYPKLSPSMIQIGIGSSMPASLWKPILNDLIKEGFLVREEIIATPESRPGGRLRNHTVISRAG